MNNAAEITVLGAGSYGTALAISLASNGHKVLLWGHEADHMARLTEQRSNEEFLSGIQFPDCLAIEADLGKALAASKNILVVVPSHVFGDVLKRAKPLLREDARIVWATKGLEPETGRLLQDVAREQLGEQYPLAVLSGPTFARELAAGLPTAISVAGTCPQFTHDLVELLHSPERLRVYANDDFTGIQLGGAVKNVIAIGAGMSDGIGFGANARTALITRGLVELSRLGVALGADASTFMGMAGLGDLVLTCTDNQSRNRRFGLALGQGKDVITAQQEIGQVVEGYRNTKEVFTLAKRLGVEMPITEQIYQVLYQGKSPVEASKVLLSRDKKSETLKK
ncbi:MAG: NAD(P)H-dependent glycerol-3-phosphate dehydrogenase [Shewanella psychromarinicola]|mgnify:FL=1|jgi:glycerol-3-phosphate dehydrogenase (NAD(P)+)|uniref:Glycerol-3-phosphate dehydrogenase [NAD(P)+] n=1 Tax=Shewanella psychromarinicola TaxID=2487742 RepID=A0A3N4E2H8_9GAMM|nr:MULTISPECIES: NAD(P)H-dependent glycerol-3-phosphate dehydrogenase [Shewanella]AZG34289.1 NAD(P)H-dependent glycerol-3-phosphate dehydrogenase [Shewanella psychromarinicola]MCL1083518.1 NAD(P)H-dependent glycerol-3-phosphate dehydrogenase [Shewanella psychromarinicola]PKG79291.1 NAD(P)H-dependent glycerol-3-phosphate dehydrogenase [Shewanella sp. Actino-trap-3]RPA32385.1 NAD(P)H-dependent glycerol-3-phosphate dehydrogenase [Shewanella psychromarinicola]|tara:strand:+ start:8284 stop:9300 length:1017 start_codon:yes stop_codon:yes gene_type:complete